MATSELIERLAAHEHEQWAHWTRYMLDNLTEEISRDGGSRLTWITTSYPNMKKKATESGREKAIKVTGISSELIPNENAQQDDV